MSSSKLAGYALLSLAILCPSITLAQERLVTEKDNLTGNERTEFHKFRDGQNQVLKANKPLLDKAARWYVGRLTWKEVHTKSLEQPTGGIVVTMNDLVNEALRHIPPARKFQQKAGTRQNQILYCREYGKSIAAVVNEILKNPAQPPIAQVNAVRILAALGETGVEDFAGPLAEIVDAPELNDAVKLHALRGLHALFTESAPFKDNALETKTLVTLDNFVKRPPNYPKSASEGEIAAFRYVRRAAVRALGAGRTPRITEKGKPLAKPALHLIKILSGDGVEPPPDLREQIEAAIAVCQLDPKTAPGYNPDYTAQHLAAFTLEFCNRFNEDRSRTGGKTLAWAVEAARIDVALSDLKKNAPDNAYVAEVANRCKDLLREVESEKPPLPASLNSVRAMVAEKPPKSKLVFTDDPDSAVKLPGPAE
ncbi:MAG: hypothetical protein AB7K24_21865 [Gemmataceae bacterium]